MMLLKISILYVVFVLFFLGAGCQPSPQVQSIKKINSDSTSIVDSETEPNYYTSCELAARHISEMLSGEELSVLRNSPQYRLFLFHHGLGALIREELLYGNSRLGELDSSCGKGHLSKTRSHPDEVSAAIIQKLWQDLNADLPAWNLEGLDPDDYFSIIHSAIVASTESPEKKDYLLLPCWVFDDCVTPPVFDAGYVDYSKKIVSMPLRQNSYLGLLYLKAVGKIKASIDLGAWLGNEDVQVTVPYVSSNLATNSSFTVAFNTMSASDFALEIYGRAIGNKNITYDELVRLQQRLKENPLYRWGIDEDITPPQIEEWWESKAELLRILLLSKRYLSYHERTGNCSPVKIRIGQSELFRSLLLRVQAEQGGRLPYLDFAGPYCNQGGFGVDESSRCEDINPTFVLAQFANTIDVQQLENIVSVKEQMAFYESPNYSLFYDYSRYLVSFILLSQRERLLTSGIPNRSLWQSIETCLQQHILNEELICASNYRDLVDMQYQLQKNRTLKKMQDFFNLKNARQSCKYPLESEIRLALLPVLLVDEFDVAQKILQRWFGETKMVCEDAQVGERKQILKQLRMRGGRYLQLANELDFR